MLNLIIGSNGVDAVLWSCLKVQSLLPELTGVDRVQLATTPFVTPVQNCHLGVARTKIGAWVCVQILISRARHSRVDSSIKVKIFILLPVRVTSETKSIDYREFGS